MRKTRKGRRSLAKMPKRVKSRRMRVSKRRLSRKMRGGVEPQGVNAWVDTAQPSKGMPPSKRLTERLNKKRNKRLNELSGLIERTTEYASHGHGQQYWNDVSRYNKEAEEIEAKLEKLKPKLTKTELTERLKELTDKIATDTQFAETQSNEDPYYHIINQDKKEANALKANLDKLRN